MASKPVAASFIPDVAWLEEIEPGEYPALFAKVFALLGALIAKMAAAPARANAEIAALAGKDRLLNVEQAADRLGVTKDWLYRKAKKLPFTRYVGRKSLRFSEQGMEKFMAEKK